MCSSDLRLIGFMADVMTGVPSIVMGLFIFSVWVLHFGFSGLAGAFALGCLMLPIVIRSTDEMLKLVPDSLREGSYALGATKARVTLTVVLPAALGGIVSGVLLAVARAAGETAPLLFTILTVTTVNPNLFSGPSTSLPSQIFVNASAPYAGAQSRGWGAALSGIVSGALLAIARAAGETAPLLFTILTVEATNTNLFSGADTALSTQIFANAQSPYTGAEARAWGAALTLIAIAFILMIVARLVTARFDRYSR